MSEGSSKPKKNAYLDWLKAILIAVVLAAVIRWFLFEPYMVEGSSMYPTLRDGEKLFVNKTIHYMGQIKRGYIVIIDGEKENVHYVKRVIGLPGDTVQAKNDKLYINGKELKESYLNSNEKEAVQLGLQLTADFGPKKVPKGQYFVMGDNRLNSMDSRNGLGLIKENRIVGRSEFVFYPFNEVKATR
ncbi:signal peptidase I [Metabacillus sp. GX 13764]|uniref:signal peptidase I n=1 Tax=Metabacillus kandeliae TaxID=2900151 RepID=UPI001E366728|nr:signal peptidase I [Metabacillus kandeliae]